MSLDLGGANAFIRSFYREEITLQPLRRYAEDRFIPILLPETAAFLRQMVCLAQPQKILEIGTAVGYSGSLMLDAGNGRLFTVDNDSERLQVARQVFAARQLTARVRIYEGDAGEILSLMSGEFDFVLLDGPKTKYPDYYPYLKRLLRRGGLLIADDVLFAGIVSGQKPAGSKGSIAESLRLFLQTLTEDGEMMTSILPLGDGVSLSIKK